jgi:CRISPR-associated protein Cst2
MGKIKGISMIWLSKADLSNLNAGEGGGGNVTELKTYDNGRKPYASGQSVRHAIREAVERNNPEVFKCTPESPCGNVEECWLCDMFGYLNPKKDEGADRRWSPIKVTPALGQIASEIVTDMLIRMSDKPKPKGKKEGQEDQEEDKSKDQRIAYVQIMSNVYRVGLSLDVANLGKVRKAQYDGKEFKGWETKSIDKDKRKKRTLALLNSIGGKADFAKQARNAASLSPDVFIAGIHSRYSHRLLRTLALDDDGNVNTDELRVIIRDLKDDEVRLFFGYTPQVVTNGDELVSMMQEFDLNPVNPIRALKNLIGTVEADEIE